MLLVITLTLTLKILLQMTSQLQEDTKKIIKHTNNLVNIFRVAVLNILGI